MSSAIQYAFGTRVPRIHRGSASTCRGSPEGRGLRRPHRDRRSGDDEGGKLGVDSTPYLILGACNPALAHRALEADPSVGVLLPCNVVLREDGPDTIVEAMDPVAALGIVDSRKIEPIAREARERLARAISSLESR